MPPHSPVIFRWNPQTPPPRLFPRVSPKPARDRQGRAGTPWKSTVRSCLDQWGTLGLAHGCITWAPGFSTATWVLGVCEGGWGVFWCLKSERHGGWCEFLWWEVERTSLLGNHLRCDSKKSSGSFPRERVWGDTQLWL
uniref:Uncharacterized protein n=1 Tax=Macaca fascicularis TaxID=9541 RepID=A0A2K5UFR3_MACFA